MSAARERVFEDALKLPQAERAVLIGDLMESLDGPADQAAQASWDTEIARRVSELESGKSKAVPWEEIRHQLRGIVGD